VQSRKEIEIILNKANISEMQKQWQEALDLYEDARFLALEAGLDAMINLIEQKSRELDAKIKPLKESSLAKLVQTAEKQEKDQDFTEAVEDYHEAIKIANDLGEQEKVATLSKKKMIAEGQKRIIEKPRTTKALFTIGNIISAGLISFSGLVLLARSAWYNPVYPDPIMIITAITSIGTIIFTVCLMATSRKPKKVQDLVFITGTIFFLGSMLVGTMLVVNFMPMSIFTIRECYSVLTIIFPYIAILGIARSYFKSAIRMQNSH